MVRHLFTLALCLLAACGGDSLWPTGGGGDPSDGGGIGAGSGNDPGGVRENVGPIFEESRTALRLLSVAAPDTLVSGSQPFPLTATVLDSGRFVEPIEVAMRFGWGDGIWSLSLQDTINSTTALFSGMFDSTLAAGLSGSQTLQLQAAGLDGGGSMMVTRGIFLENKPPVLFDPDAPTRMERQTGGRIQVRISVTDPQGAADVDSVYFKFRKPDGSFGGESEKAGGFHFLLVDNGVQHGDEEEGDGRFAYNFKIVEDALLGSYSFDFYARDRAGNLGVEISTGFELVPLER